MNYKKSCDRVLRSLPVALCAVLPWATAHAGSTAINLAAPQWETTGGVKFVRMEAFPNGILELKDGRAVLKGTRFSNGTVEFDAKFDPVDPELPTLRFHRQDADNAEEVYLRPDADCPAANDCVQYTPVFKGRMTWDMYPEYQAAAPISMTGWNHVRIVVDSGRMNVFVNASASPALTVPRLQGDSTEGGLEFRGPASFANLTVSESVEGAPLAARAAAPLPDANFARHWRVTGPMPSGNEMHVNAESIPTAATAYASIDADESGLVNLNRRFGPPTASSSYFVWLQTSMRSDRAQDKRVDLGWLRQAVVFVNGRQVFSGDNFYYPPEARRDPDGRLSLENGSFVLPLRAGDNRIDVAVGNHFPKSKNRWGWGLKMRLVDLDGVALVGR